MARCRARHSSPGASRTAHWSIAIRAQAIRVIALNEAPGHLKRVETGAWFWDGFMRIMYDTDLFPLEVRIYNRMQAGVQRQPDW